MRFLTNVKQASVCVVMLMVLIAQSPAALARPREEAQTFRIICFGDGLTSGQGLEEQYTYPRILRDKLNKYFPQFRIEVLNAGRPGDTASSAVARIGTLIAEKPDIVVLALGRTDALKGVDPAITFKALEQILNVLTHKGIYVLLTGYLAPPERNMEFAVRYNSGFPALAQRYNVMYYRDMLKGFDEHPYLYQYDGIHPNEEGAAIIAENLQSPLKDMIWKLLK